MSGAGHHGQLRLQVCETMSCILLQRQKEMVKHLYHECMSLEELLEESVNTLGPDARDILAQVRYSPHVKHNAADYSPHFFHYPHLLCFCVE